MNFNIDLNIIYSYNWYIKLYYAFVQIKIIFNFKTIIILISTLIELMNKHIVSYILTAQSQKL